MRMVVKVGTSIVSDSENIFRIDAVNRLCKTICSVIDKGHSVILVSSGAVGLGAGKMGFETYPGDLKQKQALAAIGQCELMYMYGKRFGRMGKTAAQLLLTGNAVFGDESKRNVINTLDTLLEMGCVPIINENDSVATDELESISGFEKKLSVFGDNDILSSMVSIMCGADCLVIFTNTDGLYTSNPNKDKNAQKIDRVSDIKKYINMMSPGESEAFGTGGMYSKLCAVSRAVSAGITCYISDGNSPEKLELILKGENIGTMFPATK